VIATFITLRYGESFSATKVRHLAQASRTMFEGMPGLHSKLYSILPEVQQARNVYVWEHRELAEKFLTPENCERIAELYGVQPSIEWAEVCALIENSSV